ncbi:antibiotic biosynthesis monooxygenase [Nocardioides jiangxiensis]|uniref:Antibiotic biosynthesis monooxygenase n=1 Tax=Nocardioides jiangxiensis TaxID=3064524 RepID=A0ABT9AWS9_9ACTN|nr:antibiotic biosynthesis monooxygenase [Nocardioides sp. WY-20]MDO7866946.1 antibiotic biosynthesis monooxygenase [Nocardioides sp. WY-20]
MFARSTTIHGKPENVDRLVDFVRDTVMPSLTETEGCLGISLMVDREQGHCIATSSWLDEQSLRASFASLGEVRDEAARILGGFAGVEEWEIAAMHREHFTHQGACARAVWLRTDHTEMDRGIGIYRDVLLPMLEALPGFCSASLMVDRETRRACATTAFESRDAMEASREESWAIRERGVREAGVDVLDAAEFELAIAHLRVPEVV